MLSRERTEAERVVYAIVSGWFAFLTWLMIRMLWDEGFEILIFIVMLFDIALCFRYLYLALHREGP